MTDFFLRFYNETDMIRIKQCTECLLQTNCYNYLRSDNNTWWSRPRISAEMGWQRYQPLMSELLVLSGVPKVSDVKEGDSHPMLYLIKRHQICEFLGSKVHQFFWRMPFHIFIHGIIYHHLAHIANLIEHISVIYWSFGSGMLLMIMSNNMGKYNANGLTNNHST